MTRTRGGPLRLAVVGGGVAGALLAWRTTGVPGGASVDLFTGGAGGRADASGVSGGLVRGFEPGAADAEEAAESLAEIRGSATLRMWSGYRETGSVYLLPPGAAVDEPVAVVEKLLPGSAEVSDGAWAVRTLPFREVPPDAVVVSERHAGHISPDALRAAALRAAAEAGATVRTVPVEAVTRGPGVRTADGRHLAYDRVVVAAGAWTPGLLARSGLPAAGLRTKHIQYSLFATPLTGLGAFVDENSGLYGRPWGKGTFLLGQPADRWGVDPDEAAPDAALTRRAAGTARRVLGADVAVDRSVAACDCYHDPAGLALRPLGGGLHTFTGGSGGAAKTVVAASRRAARALLD
ncbi:FAD-dependent oxidoreductase [Streptomyces sp. CNQ431]|uniref:FAD-dependent oxidoreductase n=1 Tax=Streptomyces sp. CNQ431 TaxID=1571532 RepID=UPI00053F11AE|nr:FAD-dependent oxidoreductase [Streptomyces sp. CNQ431]